MLLIHITSEEANGAHWLPACTIIAAERAKYLYGRYGRDVIENLSTARYTYAARHLSSTLLSIYLLPARKGSSVENNAPLTTFRVRAAYRPLFNVLFYRATITYLKYLLATRRDAAK